MMGTPRSNAMFPSAGRPRRPRVLFFAEAVTLAHAARPVTLARALDPAKFDVHLAWDDRYAALFPDLPLTTHALRTIPSAKFLAALAAGTPIYRYEELRDYVAHDLRLIDAIKPDLIVGDFRLSLTISAAKAKIPHLALANAYWSPYAKTQYPMPDHPINRVVGRRIGGLLFGWVRPFVFSRYAAPVNRLRLEHGLPSLGTDLRRVYTHGDHTLYADVPTLSTIEALPDHHHFIGPVHWSPVSELPAWWPQLLAEDGDARPLVYVNLGSSGHAKLLPVILQSLGGMDVRVIAATAGSPPPATLPANVRIAPYLPGDQACRLAALVICNGGSPATQQALAAGKPVIGVPGNLDQHLNMQAITRCGAGLALLREHCRPARIQDGVRSLLSDIRFTQSAGQLAQAMRAYDSNTLFNRIVAQVLGMTETSEPHEEFTAIEPMMVGCD